MEICANCQDPLRPGGRPSAAGQRFCMKPECRRARWRSRRPEMDKRPCSRCGRALRPRPLEGTAEEQLGRWCTSRRACMQEKRNTLSRFTMIPVQNAKAEEQMARVRAAERRTCPKCGYEDRPVGFMHVAPKDGPMQGDRCEGLGHENKQARLDDPWEHLR